ncbi:MAG TPA: hypothetical protein VIR45_14065 [Kiloniellaceae bacterium]
MPFTLTLPDHIRPVLLIYVKSDSGGLECGVEIGGLTAEKPVNMAYLTKAAISFLNENGNVRDARIMTPAEIDDYLARRAAAMAMLAAPAHTSH